MPKGANQYTDKAGLTAKAPRWSMRVTDADDEAARELAAKHGYELAEWVRMRTTTTGPATKKPKRTEPAR